MTCVEPLTSIDPYLHILNRAEKPFTYPVNPCLLLAVGLGAEFLE
jgi:hypothetical protein